MKNGVFSLPEELKRYKSFLIVFSSGLCISVFIFMSLLMYEENHNIDQNKYYKTLSSKIIESEVKKKPSIMNQKQYRKLINSILPERFLNKNQICLIKENLVAKDLVICNSKLESQYLVQGDYNHSFTQDSNVYTIQFNKITSFNTGAGFFYPLITFIVSLILTITLSFWVFSSASQNIKLKNQISKTNYAESAKRSSERKFSRLEKAVTETQGYSIITLDTVGKILSWNLGAEKIYGYKESDMIGTSVERLFTPEAYEVLDSSAFHKTLRSDSFNQETWCYKADGNKFWAHISVTPTLSKNGECIGYSQITLDMTEKKKANDAREKSQKELEFTLVKLQHQHKELEQFSYMAAHDLQSPLKNIFSYAVLLEDFTSEKTIGADNRSFINTIKNETEKMIDFVGDLLKFSRSGQSSVEYKDINLQKLVMQEFDSIKENFPDKISSIETEYLPENFKADPIKFTHIIHKLISNSFKYSNEILNIKISYSSSEDNVYHQFKLEDNGIGISDQDSEKVFLPFRRGRNTSAEGTGIGLALVKKVVQAHGGSIHFKSTPGQSTTFYFSIMKEQIEPEEEYYENRLSS